MKRTRRRYSGINIQFPISRTVLSGSKTIETRTYPIPRKFIGKELLLIETPGSDGTFKARIVGTIVFGDSFKYPSSSSFYKDQDRHCVTPDSPWKWSEEKPKWGWPILKIRQFKATKILAKRKGIRFTNDILL